MWGHIHCNFSLLLFLQIAQMRGCTRHYWELCIKCFIQVLVCVAVTMLQTREFIKNRNSLLIVPKAGTSRQREQHVWPREGTVSESSNAMWSLFCKSLNSTHKGGDLVAYSLWKAPPLNTHKGHQSSTSEWWTDNTKPQGHILSHLLLPGILYEVF